MQQQLRFSITPGGITDGVSFFVTPGVHGVNEQITTEMDMIVVETAIVLCLDVALCSPQNVSLENAL